VLGVKQAVPSVISNPNHRFSAAHGKPGAALTDGKEQRQRNRFRHDETVVVPPLPSPKAAPSSSTT
jgi:hypothetical protein